MRNREKERKKSEEKGLEKEVKVEREK